MLVHLVHCTKQYLSNVNDTTVVVVVVVVVSMTSPTTTWIWLPATRYHDITAVAAAFAVDEHNDTAKQTIG